jgi:hypothetical protein
MCNDYIIKFNIKQIHKFMDTQKNITIVDYEYNNKKYIFNKLKYLYIDVYYYIIGNDCIAIVINNQKLNANINIINSCVPLIYYHIINEELFLLAINFIKDKKYIKVITIEDNSHQLYFDKLSKIINSINLPLLSILTTGHTWYGKYNFRPVNILNDIKIDEIYNNKYNDNNKRMNKLTIKNVKNILLKYFNDDIIIKIINKNPNMLVKNFISLFLNQYDISATHFEKIYYDLFNDIGLFNINDQTYGLFL